MSGLHSYTVEYRMPVAMAREIASELRTRGSSYRRVEIVAANPGEALYLARRLHSGSEHRVVGRSL